MTEEADKYVSAKLLTMRRVLAPYSAGQKVMTRKDAQQLEAWLKRTTLQAVQIENRLLQLCYPTGLPADTEEVGMLQLYAVPDGMIDLGKVLLDYVMHPADRYPDDMQALARRAMELAGDAMRLAHEVSRHRWNAKAWQERSDRLMAEGAGELARFEAAPPDNVVFLGRERPIGG